MAYTSSPTSPVGLALDGVAKTRAQVLIPAVLAGYSVQPRPAWSGQQPPLESVDLAYVLTGAVRIGLNRFTLPGVQPPTPEWFEPRAGKDVSTARVEVLDEDILRAEALSDQLIVPLPEILSAAVCTGLAMMAGDPELAGPFEV